MTELQRHFQEKAESYKDYTVDCRRKIHEMAELSNEEVNTSAFVEEELKKIQNKPDGENEPKNKVSRVKRKLWKGRPKHEKNR